MKIHWIKHLLEKIPPGVSISLPGVSIDPGSLAQYFADEDDSHKDAILAEIDNLINNVDGGFKDLKGDLEKKGVDTQERFDELLKVILQIYDRDRLSGEATLQPNYDNYLKHIIDELNEWQKRYAPMFAKFKSLTLFARVTQNNNKYDPQELIELVHKNKSLVIIGPAGAGKTTTLKRVALDNASDFLKQKPYSYIPIIVPLRDYGAVKVESIITSVIKPWKLSFDNIEQDLISGKFVIIFDGLNEVPSKFRQQCFQEIRIFTREYRANKFLFTSRNFEYHDDWVSIDEKPIPVCEIESLTRGQIEDYIRRYFDGQKELAGKLIYELKLHDSRVWENSKSLVRLAGAPLLLQMLILTFEEKKRIPKSEGELLLRFVDEILLKWEPSKAAAEIDPEVKKLLLATIAWEMQQGEYSSINKRSIFPVFVKKLEELKRIGRANPIYESNQIWQELQNNHLIIEDDDLVYWPHPLYQELFVGLSLRDSCFDSNWEPIFKEIYVQFHSLDAKWYGNPAFEVGLRMLDVIPQSHRLNGLAIVAAVNPLLAKEAFMRFEPEHNLGMIEEFSVVLRKNLLSNKWEGILHRNFLIVASYISPDYFCSLFNDGVTLCPTWEGRDEAARLLWFNCRGVIGLQVLKILKDVCKADADAHVRRTAFNFLILSEEIHSKEMLSFLTQIIFEESEGFLSDVQLHLPKLLDLAFVVTMLCDFSKNESSREKNLRIIWCLGKSNIRNTYAQKTLLEFVGKNIDQEIRSSSVASLASYPSDETIKVLCRLVDKDSSKLVRLNAINSLYSMPTAKALNSIVSALFDDEEVVAEKAVTALVDLSKKEKKVVNLLLRSLKQEKPKGKALLALSQIAISEEDEKIQKKICKELFFTKICLINMCVWK